MGTLIYSLNQRMEKPWKYHGGVGLEKKSRKTMGIHQSLKNLGNAMQKSVPMKVVDDWKTLEK